MIERLILIRHGETVDNVRGVAQGWSDSELSQQGQEQVDRVAQRLGAIGVGSLWSSTLPRAIATAEKIGRSIGLEPRLLDDLREMNCGDWEGLSFPELRRGDPETYRRWLSDPRQPCPGGESYHDVLVRMERALETIRAELDGHPSPVVIVSHGTAIRVLATSLLGVPLAAARNFAQDNAAVNAFERRADRWVLRVWNDTTHCGGPELE
ncbi:MAG TPA: histidine phosphatase family protein [Thermoanaerobaculia bacterium]|nr:histidine phosphatase family protein [Thermoanaerobaculia bacterium]